MGFFWFISWFFGFLFLNEEEKNGGLMCILEKQLWQQCGERLAKREPGPERWVNSAGARGNQGPYFGHRSRYGEWG